MMKFQIREDKPSSAEPLVLDSPSKTVVGMNNSEFLNFLYGNIVGRLEQCLPDIRFLNLNNNFLIEKKKTHIVGFSILFLLEVLVEDKCVLHLIAKTKKSGNISEYEKAVFNKKQVERARREYNFLEQVYNVFNHKNELNVPTPILFIDDFNTLIFTHAKGTDLGKFINQFEYSFILTKSSQIKIKRIITLVAKWLKYFHKHFHLQEMTISKEELIENILFDENKIKKWKYLPLEKIYFIKDQIYKKGFSDILELPCANLHGDFKYRHIWNHDDKSITVFDFGNEFEYNIIYEDIAGFLTETILLDYGINTNLINNLAKIIEDIFLESYDNAINKDLLNVFIIRYLFKKWFKRRRRIYKFLDNKTKKLKLLTPFIRKFAEKYTDYYFNKKINERLSRIS